MAAGSTAVSDGGGDNTTAYGALAHLYHALFLGMQLTISTRKGEEVMGDWMFRLFRRQHLDKFLSSFDKLGLSDLPHAVACAKYHVLSNGMGGVPVEYMYESDRKAWVRFRYPRWMYHGPTLCGVTEAVSHGFLKGWYAHNGVSLGNPRLGYVCVSQDMTGEFGLCGYFQEYDHDLAPEERLRFAPDELPPPFDAADQPAPPATEWSPLRAAKANRNYAMEYVRNGVCELAGVLPRDEVLALLGRAARLIGLQYHRETAQMLGVDGEDALAATRYLAAMLSGMDDEVIVDEPGGVITHHSRRLTRGLADDDAGLLQSISQELWLGTARAHRELLDLTCEQQGDALCWRVTQRS